MTTADIPLLVQVNGCRSDTVSVCDRGLHYGDGLFETVAVYRGQAMRLKRHWLRLREGCRRLAIQSPPRESLYSEIETLCMGQERAVLKIIITRGAAGRGYRPPAGRTVDGRLAPAATTRILILYPWPSYARDFNDQGIQLRICQTRLAINPGLAGIKHLNRLDQVLAQSEWYDPAVPEGLMMDTDGNIIEGTVSNLFLIRDSALYTPDLAGCGVKGIMRDVILEQAAVHGIPCHVTAVTRADIEQADELFVCNSIAGIWPVCRLENRFLEVGVITRRLQQLVQLSGPAPKH